MNLASFDKPEEKMKPSRKRQQPDEESTDCGVPPTLARLTVPLIESVAESTPFINIPITSLRLEDVKPTFEPLKVCLDDDSSLEDGDEDIFDDKDFYFGDDDFQALIARETKGQRTLTSNTITQPAQIPHLTPPFTSGNQNAYIPSREADTMLPATIGTSDAPEDIAIAIEVPSAVAISQASESSSLSAPSLGNLTLVSQESSTPHASRRNSTEKKTKTSKRRVVLSNNVAVIPIPMRTEYPDAIRPLIWSSAVELYENAARNSIEFAAEGWNWRTVTDDEYMVPSASGERIHPIHFINAFPPTQNTLSHGEGDTGEKNITSHLDMQVDLQNST
eukprot:CAMPEP_0171342272 /NCGR_PEP_ID=MMETSP0878-20121228/13879_1 /TAXON_ID=67004 /ORGANISM="Thalassiosira weissflogii, Strain CCMP1336" /LENGTH=333 /DNA_ID=CAMNT_0011844897 /DNA_START=309 /DNA_END=1310 /DNA_ORIENTATION=-